ncbi:hypothetical protein [Rhodococcus sp. JVH1]|uniref:hypothetical protein n=1 Tax=Rhodococcus sp. JVH1 TaxID=745408 RepID=UPI00027207E3|nr:hypothetical protein [Rhodococcus sp. JVH1]EJJ01008.1 hypothetical protein JVH1_1634 [Rhodococcus sp. JVH1]
MRPTHVYRSTAPDLLAALEKQREDWLSFTSRCDAWAAEHPMDDQDRKLAAFYGEGATMRGYFPLDGDDTTYARRVTDAIFPGWKFHRRTGVWVPDTRSDLGKELARTLPRVTGEATIAERMTGLSTWIKVAGSETRDGSYHAGCARITLASGVAQAECPGDPLDRISDTNREKFDRYWSPVKLSDFYAEQGL